MTANIKRYVKSFVVALVLVLIVPAVSANAAPDSSGGTSAAPKQCTPTQNAVSFFPAWYDNGLCGSDGTIVSPASFDKQDTAASFSKWIGIIALNLVTMLLYVVGYVSLGYIIFGGFKYMTNGDNSSGTAAAKKTITNAVIGLVLSIMSVAIVKFIAAAVGGQ
jgi:uncharacterized membrane protein